MGHDGNLRGKPMAQFDSIDLDLLRKYSKPGPRYTSYPTAPLFSEAFGAEEFKQAIAETNRPGDEGDLSLYFHIPFCDTLCYFCGCTMMVTKDRGKIARYIDYLERELDLTAPALNSKRRVSQLHWGGGTPTTLAPEEILRLGRMIQDRIPFHDGDVEASCEIDPRELTFQHLEALRTVGFNRLSMGVQDFNETVMKAVNRFQSEELVSSVVEWSRRLEFKSINLDFIYGLAHQTLSTFEETVDKLILLNPDRIAVFNFAHVPWIKKHQNLIDSEALPSPDEKLRILEMMIKKLSDAGYWYIGMDHFAKPDDELAVAQRNKTLYRNFQGYSTRSECDLYAFGMSSISQFKNIYAQNEKTIPDYYAAIDSGTLATRVGYRMTEDDHIRRRVIMKLMCDFELEFAAVEKEFSIDFNDYFRSSLVKLQPLIADGLLSIGNGRLDVTEIGRLMIRNIAMCFDAYLDDMQARGQRFSKTV
jgi:oxygen-independent coproporphyrinogen-3 oxidase